MNSDQNNLQPVTRIAEVIELLLRYVIHNWMIIKRQSTLKGFICFHCVLLGFIDKCIII